VSDRPLPAIDDESRPYWDAAREHRFVLQRCAACGEWVFYARALCPHCHAGDLAWTDASGRGTVYSFTVAHRPAAPWFADKTPYVVALIDLEEGPRMLSSLRVAPGEVRVGQRVRVAFEEASEEVTLPVFEVDE
jgi:uncharacterized protein